MKTQICIFFVVLSQFACAGKNSPPVAPQAVETAPETHNQKPANSSEKNPSKTKNNQYEAVLISKGTFLMGCTTEQSAICHDSNQPSHQVTIGNDFYMMKSEVTQGLYETVMGENPSHFKNCGADCPVEFLRWFMAVEFANALSTQEGLEPCYQIGEYRQNEKGNETATVAWSKGPACTGWRLPTEAEWEYAARGGENHKYSGSNDPSEVAWHDEEYDNGSTHPVCTKKVNGYGLCDMTGNVQEWCWDWYQEDFYASSPQADPTGPTSGDMRILRGGSWNKGIGGHELNFRAANAPTGRSVFGGFRLLRTAQ